MAYRLETHFIPRFALILCLCHAGSLGSIGAAFLYMVKKGSRKAPISPLLKQATALVAFAYLLTHGVGFADFFLHKGTGTIRHLLRDKETSALSYGRTFNSSICDYIDGIVPQSTPGLLEYRLKSR